MRPGAVLLVLLLGPPLVLAQGEAQLAACRAPILSIQDPPVPFDPGQSVTLLFAIENPNGRNVDGVRATVTTTAPAGWSATAAQRELTLQPNDAQVDVLAVTAPNRGSGQRAGNITLLVTFVCSNGEIQTTASTTENVPVEISPLSVPWPIVLGAFALLAGGVGALALRRLRRGVSLSVAAPEREVEPGKSVKFTLHLHNHRGRPERFTFLATGLPEGWTAHLALVDVELEPGEEKTLWVILKAPADAPVGSTVEASLRLESPRGARESTGVRVRAKVYSAASGSPG